MSLGRLFKPSSRTWRKYYFDIGLQCRQRIIWKSTASLSMFCSSGRDKQFVFPKTSKWGIRSDSRRDEIFPDMSWWMWFNLKPARCVRDLPTPYGVNLPVPLSHSAPPFHLSVCLCSEVRGLSAQQRRGLCQQRPQLQREARWDGVCWARGGQPLRACAVHGDGTGASRSPHLGDHREAGPRRTSSSSTPHKGIN